MDENLNVEQETDIEMGIVKISDEVVEVIAGLAASEIDGIEGMSTTLVGGITQILSGKKNLSKGIKVNVEENSATIDLYVVVKYGIKIVDVAKAVQENVKKSVELMTGLNLTAINVYVQNVVLPKEEEKIKEKQE
ncbi:Asp23/Gls24 family envelope stress response protein [Clostridium botulinum C]|uniref:Asp23/Gls24 family envelope stress response protein n=3 Tax=Clostridium botulinum TaxID=1491 RepID=A0A9Q4XXB7_CLOBO|nr:MULTISPECIES: Asp23/Gls24 family envelope stress response protein [Clostridium]AYF54939.1 Asp23/Gls24 family envelope stress response protein [Clostridium novyi]EES90786.1 alkaline shock protein [Clostridium botulinum D str. 1873]KEI10582.1 alkaline-shock protein [Clostridium sp. K25]MBO3441966.1 Asp23/Gls24 family envelope stress response protein [Clostridium haemolyticum]MCD3194175.1 Asp23/Gls24 family envelope stress response protein [Clostridium botulinum C]